MKKDFIVRRSITMVEGKPFVETYSEQELVRCKDCAYLNRDQRFMNYGYCSYFKDEFYAKVKPDKNFYCGAGKRSVK